MVTNSSIDDLEDELRVRVKSLDQDSKKEYYRQLDHMIRDPDTYAVLNFFFVAGLHHFYLKKWTRGLINLGLLIFGITLVFGSFEDPTFVGVGVFVIVGVYLVELAQLFYSQQIVREYNHDVGVHLFAELGKRSTNR